LQARQEVLKTVFRGNVLSSLYGVIKVKFSDCKYMAGHVLSPRDKRLKLITKCQITVLPLQDNYIIKFPLQTSHSSFHNNMNHHCY